ncbi:protein-L-isoaspartate(D-aspartate) O-methyltransferase [Streptomyces syringium]|uniref:protein-L-isoaspartate(D-aspartate) O-methyltransferase n=1 Tax=Streptomyces syringium TaxID=76729 RepID=UPI0033C0241B
MTTACDYTMLRRNCAEALAADQQFGAPWIREAFERVPREVFAPPRAWLSTRGEDGAYPFINRATDPEAWARAVYTHDRALITQINDGNTPGGQAAGGRLSSSLSSLRVVVRQLSHLDPQPGRRGLHIGTGSGYDSALLAERVGARNVITVEVDHRLAAGARRALDTAGYGDVQTVVGDGEHGWSHGAPYAWLLSTASAMRTPWAWIQQMAPGGVIVTPYRGLALVRLVVADDGESASGPIVDAMAFMPLRGQRGRDVVDIRPVIDATMPRAEKLSTTTDLSVLGEILGAELLFHILVHDAHVRFGETWWFQSRDASSWAAWKPTGHGRQWGPRRLLDEAEAAVTAWREAGEPDLTDLGVTVRPDEDRLWAGRGDGPSWLVT